MAPDAQRRSDPRNGHSRQPQKGLVAVQLRPHSGVHASVHAQVRSAAAAPTCARKLQSACRYRDSAMQPQRETRRNVSVMATTATSWLAEDASVDGSIHIAAPILQRKRLYRITKRCFDIVCSFFALVILSAPMLVIALVVALDSPGAPIFRQERLGLNGKPFWIYKFRSMRLNAEENGPQWGGRPGSPVHARWAVSPAHPARRASPVL